MLKVRGVTTQFKSPATEPRFSIMAVSLWELAATPDFLHGGKDLSKTLLHRVREVGCEHNIGNLLPKGVAITPMLGLSCLLSINFTRMLPLRWTGEAGNVFEFDSVKR